MLASQKVDQWVMNTYMRNPITFVKGEGAKLWDEQGKKYTDFLAGIAVTNLGHCHPKVTQAVKDQVETLVHVSNLFYTQPQAKVAELLTKHTAADRVFFCNSGAEANEGAIKAARLWGKKHLNGAYGIITAKQSFHGRTLATLTATGQSKIQEGFEPLVQGFKYVDYDDLAQAEAAWDDNTCAIMVEPLQGEGGVIAPSAEYLQGLKALAQKKGGLLILDEVQTGLGRTGKLMGYENFGVKPDVFTLAKGLANGLPAGAVCASQAVADVVTPGKHATTFGAGPVVMAAAGAVLEVLTAPGFIDEVASKGDYLRAKLDGLVEKYPAKLSGVRGLGLIQGLVCKAGCMQVLKELLQAGFIANCTQDVVLRFVPPLIISTEQIDGMIQALDKILEGWKVD